jgi:DNA-binding transcriptional ArsR family regulator
MDEIFTVLADPTRRHILELLAERERSVVELVAAFTVSQPAISRHLRVLRENGLVHVRGAGQRRIYELDARPLAEVDAWLDRYRTFWNERLDHLEQQIERQRREKSGKHSKE